MKSYFRASLFVAVAASAGMASAANTATNLPFKPLILQAIDSPVGAAQETFPADAQWVKLIRMKLGTDGPVTVSTKVIHRWKQEGCARVSTDILMHKARFDNAKRDYVDQSFSVELNTCRDGQPPLEAMDLRALKDTMSDEPDPQQSTVHRFVLPPRRTASSVAEQAARPSK